MAKKCTSTDMLTPALIWFSNIEALTFFERPPGQGIGIFLV